jgi:hypothetical protein
MLALARSTMRARLTLSLVAATALLAAIPLGLACSSGNQASTGDDGGADANDEGDASDDTNQPFEASPEPDATSNVCTYNGTQTDPVALCTQQQALTFELQYAYTKGTGVAPGWSSVGPGYAAVSGHDWQDDLGLAGALGGYLCSASVYGNTHSTDGFLAVLGDLAPVLRAELAASPSPLAGVMDGEIYFRLRWAQAAYAHVDALTSTTLGQLADAFAASLAAAAVVVPPSDGSSPGGTILGTPSGSGQVTYSPAQEVMAAAALLDEASRHATDPDAGLATSYLATATSVLSYVFARGANPAADGLFYQSLMTSSDPEFDTPTGGMPTSDSLLTDTQAAVVLGLARAQDALTLLQGTLDGGAPDATALGITPYWNAGSHLVEGMLGDGLYDGMQSTPGAVPGAFLEGMVVSSGAFLTNKTTLGNAWTMGAYARIVVGGAGSRGWLPTNLRAGLVQYTPAHSSLFTIVTDSQGQPEQQAFLRAGSQSFGYALAYPTDAGTQEMGATNYRSDAVHALVEGLTQLWHGVRDAPCAP